MRRIVTAHDAEGKSYIASDEVVPVTSLWTTRPDQPLGAAASGERLQVSHATGDTRHFVATIQPSKDPKPDMENRLGFHRTPGVAYCYMLTGEIVFLVDTKEVRLKAGDLVVERNTMHSWRNEGSIPVSMLITTVTVT
jgi:mannose-6-phosphate isomerase-like protein (cupin superfamily)